MPSLLKRLGLFVERNPNLSRFIWLIKFVVNYSPLIGVCFLFVYAYDVYVFKFVFGFLLKKAESSMLYGLTLLIVYNLLTILAISNYVRSVFSSPTLTQQTLSRLGISDTEERFCEHCNKPKPKRTHHCFWCSVCVLKMDHHCPWLGNCVGHHNYKFFILMLLYTFLSGLFGGPTLSAAPTEMVGRGKLICIAVASALCLGVGILLVFHIYLLLGNKTTLECGNAMAQCPKSVFIRHKYDLGLLENIKSVFGERYSTWWLPIKPEFVDPLKLRDIAENEELLEDF